MDVRKTYPQANAVGASTIFNISGNKYRLVTYINYRAGKVAFATKNTVLEVDPKRYGRLLARKLPAVIRTAEENERLIAQVGAARQTP